VRATAETVPQAASRAQLARRLRTVRRAVLVGLLIAGGLVMIAPFAWMISTSLKTRAEVFVTPPTLIPIVPQWHNYADMWNALPFASFFLNSFKLAILNTVGQLVSCSMAAFAFSALRFRFREPLFALLLVTLISVVALLTRVLAMRTREGARKLELQAWHLRQILPVR